MTARRVDTVVVGGGVIGLSLAYELSGRRPDRTITLIEKEPDVARHASGRNSGVLHAGFYYSADSLKARLTASGNRKMKAFCAANGLRVNECGKVVVARDESEVPVLRELKRRGDANGVPLSLVDERELAGLEPNARTAGLALYSPTTASVDPVAFCLALRARVAARGVELRMGTAFLGADPGSGVVRTSRGDIACDYLVNCAGLYADRVARAYGLGLDYAMLPFKGAYLRYLGPREDARMNIYPVPDLRNPFLGVHFTKTVSGDVHIGPTAAPAFWREQYGLLDNFKPGELAAIGWLNLKLLWLNPSGFRSIALSELRKLARGNLIADARRLVRRLEPRFEPHPSGIRAQLLDLRSNELVMDFKIAHSPNSTHLLNAVSPGFTCSFSIAGHVADQIEANR